MTDIKDEEAATVSPVQEENAARTYVAKKIITQNAPAFSKAIITKSSDKKENNDTSSEDELPTEKSSDGRNESEEINDRVPILGREEIVFYRSIAMYKRV